VRLVKGSHIVVPRLVSHDRCYIFQNADNRIFFAIPYERDFTLIGTTDQDFQGDVADVRISESEIAYLCAGASDYFRTPVTPDQVVWTYSGVRPLYDDGATAAQAATRDYVLALDAPDGQPASLSVFGGKITTYRRLAETALARIAPHLPTPKPAQVAGWTARAALPGGDFPRDGYEALVAQVRDRHGFITETLARRLVRSYGTRAIVLLDGAKSLGDLGPAYGAGITAAELAYLKREEFVTCAADAVWRRSRLGLRLTPAEIERIDLALARL
jgi:glycerol-3-phosphate dehydrogenase